MTKQTLSRSFVVLKRRTFLTLGLSLSSLPATSALPALALENGRTSAAVAHASQTHGETSLTPKVTTPHDSIPDFDQNPTIRSVPAGGLWSDSSTWDLGRTPISTDVVWISPGSLVTIGSNDATGKVLSVRSGGHLRFQPDRDTRLTAATILVHEGGQLEIGSETAPALPNVRAEIVIADQPLDSGFDPDQYGTGLIGFGKVTAHGSTKTPSFVRLAAEPRAGESTLALAQPVSGWRLGDRLILPDTRHLRDFERRESYQPQWEQLVLAAVSDDGRTLTLTNPLRYDHPGARDGDDRLEFLPHVGNLTRNVVIRSANPNGTRGHALLTHRADVDIRYASFEDLGRTTIDPLDSQLNHIGRYALHMHHVMGPRITPANGYQFTLIGNAVSNSAKWGVTVHNSHYGLVRENVIFNASGAGVMTEDGSESFNLFERNFVAVCFGTGGGAADRLFFNPPEFGLEGSAFWFRGPSNTVRDNVAATTSAYGYTFGSIYLGTVNTPAFKGADTSIPDESLAVDMNATPLLEFRGNEIYGATPSGLTIWWIGTFGDSPNEVNPSIIKDFRVWHHYYYGFYGYPSNRLTFDGFVARGDKDVVRNPYEFPLGIWFGDYMSKNVIVQNANIQGLRHGIIAPPFPDERGAEGENAGLTIIRNSTLRNANNIVTETPWSVNGAEGLPPKKLLVENVRFQTVNTIPPEDQVSIFLGYSDGSAKNLIQRDEVFVHSYNQTPGDDFRVFYVQQASDFIVPQSGTQPDPTGRPRVGSPDEGLTNLQNWTRYGIAIAGSIAPCANTRDGIGGYVCPLTGSLRGDLNLDGILDARDLVILANYLVGNLQPGSPPFLAPLSAADMNGDGLVNAVDLVLLQNRLLS